MRLLLLALLLASFAQAAPFRLEPGDNRYVPVKVTRIPTLVAGHFRVLQGAPTVHMEFMTEWAYRRFSRGRDFDSIASSPEGRDEEIRQTIGETGWVYVVIVNESKTAGAVVDLDIHTELTPDARVLPPERRLTVILVSFGIFFALVSWSGWRLWRAAGMARG
jgi:hypothetical protein